MDNDEVREMLEGGPGRPAGHVADVPEGVGNFSFGSQWSGLAKLAEELGELQTVIGKLLAFGGYTTQHWQGDLLPMLEDEMGDVWAAIDHVTHHTRADRTRVLLRRDLKVELFEKWHVDGKNYRDSQESPW